VSQVICSDLERAVQTGKIVAIEWGAKVSTDARFREQGLGRFEGLPDDELLAASVGLDLSDPDLRLGGGESAREVAERMAEAWAALPVDVPVVVVSHGDAIRVLLGILAGHPVGSGPRIEVGNGAVAVVDTANSVRWLKTESQ
jgi:broad specificity phosphatase PhoE